jgi:hypothetical protein
MAALGDRPAAQIAAREIEMLLQTVAATGVSARSVNRTREIVCAVFNYGMKSTTYSLPTNPIDGSALRCRYKRARDAAGLRPLRWHDLRHTFGWLLVAGASTW